MEERPWRYYTPPPKTLPFFESKSPLLLLTGPNGGGKTRMAANLLAAYATGYNHWNGETYEVPNVCWAACLDRLNQQPIMMKELHRALPKGTRWIAKEEKWLLPPPWRSEIYVKSMDGQNPSMKFESDRILAGWFDEEKEGDEGLKIWKAAMRRTKPGWPLRLFMTVTPVQGYTWSYDYLYKADSPLRFQNVQVVEFELQDCLIENGGFLSPEEVQAAIDRCKHGNPPILDPYEYDQRIRGKYTYGGGRPAFPIGVIMQKLEGAPPIHRRFKIKPGMFGNGLVTPVLTPDPLGELVMIVPPERGREYLIGADCAMGLRQDSSVGSVWSRDFPIEVAYWASNEVPPAAFAHVLAAMGTLYNNAMVAPESNSEAGAGTLGTLQSCYGHIYTRQLWNSRTREMTKQLGFRTMGHERGLLWSTMREYLDYDNFLPSRAMLAEARDMIVDKEGRIDHMDGRHDDHLIAGLIALVVSKMNPAPKYEPWGTYRESYSGPAAEMGWG